MICILNRVVQHVQVYASWWSTWSPWAVTWRFSKKRASYVWATSTKLSLCKVYIWCEVSLLSSRTCQFQPSTKFLIWKRWVAVEIKIDRERMTGTPQHSLHATVPHSAVWRVACKLNPCTQALRMGDERFLSNVFLTFFYFFLNVFYIYDSIYTHAYYIYKDILTRSLFPHKSYNNTIIFSLNASNYRTSKLNPILT